MQRTIKGVDQLSASERVSLDEILTLANIDGVVTGVTFGPESWDVRPLILDHGQLSIVRLLAPVRTPDTDQAVRATCEAFERIFSKQSSKSFQVSVGYQAGRIWFSRPFLKATLAELVNPFDSEGHLVSSGAVASLLRFLLDLYQSGFVHGNLALSNLGFDSDQLVVLDPCFHSLPKGAEITEDLHTLQKIFSLMRFEGCSPSLVAELVNIGTGSGDPLARLESFMKKLSGKVLDMPARQDLNMQSPELSQPSPAGPRGKLIRADVSVSSPMVSHSVISHSAPPSTSNPVVEPTLVVRSASFSLPEFFKTTFGSRRSQLIWLGVMIGFFGIAAILSNGFGILGASQSSANFSKLWSSNRSEDQLAVVEAALTDPFSSALTVIRSSVLAGKSPPVARSEILKLAFDERWYADLSAIDRRTVLSIALGDLVPAPLRQIAPFSSLHPGVLLALAGSVTLDNSGEMFAEIPWQRFAILPAPFAAGIQALAKLGVTELRSLPARAYAHLALGEVSVNSLGHYFVPSSDVGVLRAQLQAVLPFFEKNAASAATFEEFLASAGLSLQGDYSWFVADKTAQWQNAKPLQRVQILAGMYPTLPLPLEQSIDLLQFPIRELRDLAVKALAKSALAQHYQSLLLVLASDENHLTRSQNIFLVSALQVPDEEAFAFLARWFSGEPDPDTVFLILLSRSRIGKPAPFDIEGARYLIDRQWNAATEELAELVRHPEPLARALAYSRLDPKRGPDLKILKAQLSADPSERMRGQIREKLQSAGVR